VVNLVDDASRKEGLDPRLVREVARQESGFRPCAVSAKGALGIMQLMPSTAKDLELDNPFDPRGNITAGSRFLKLLLDRYEGDIASALGAYNAGPARVDKAGGVPAITETRQYVSTILNRLSSER
jgi:soluble lytic murein transglycosylase-like protein